LTRALECRVVRKDGSCRWTVWNATSFPESQTFYATAQDVTDRHAAEDALRASEETLRTTGEFALDGIIRLDPDGNVAQWNAAAERMFGFTSREILGISLHETLVPVEVRERYLRGWVQFRESGQGPFIGKVQELEAVRKDGSRFPVEVSIGAVSLHGQWNAVGIVRDITERKRAEADLVAAKRAAEAANRSKSEFLANMSHEIRTPMNGVIGLTSLVLDTPLSDEQRRYLDGVMLSAEALLKIINDILDFSKIEAGRLELETLDFDLRETLENTVRTLALRAHEKGLELLCDVRTEAPDALVGDPARLWQVLVNLVGNAIKFTPEGEVAVTVAVESLANDEVCLLFTISDTGIGIPPEKQNALFKPFSQVDSSMTRKYGGTGLGLAISAQIVELMKGRIWFESEVGKGTKFHFTARFGLRPATTPKRAPLPPSGLDGLRVLVVDDNVTNRLILSNMLTHWRMRPAEAEGGNVALQLLRDAHQAGQPFGLILLDVMMPVMDGFTVLERIRQMPEINRPVIMMLSSRDEPGDSLRSRTLGAAAYIVKPIRPSELLDAIVDSLGISLKDAEEPQAPAAPGGAEPPGPSLHVLVAEDNPINQMLAVRILEKAGHSVAVANNGEEVLIAVAREAFDVVLMDVQMPVMDGFEATALIRQQEQGTDRHLPIVAMTAHAMKGDRERCLEAGMDGYVAKPVQKEELFGAIAAAAPGKSPVASR
jgi:PAS domain S-box-containing protein